MTPNWFEPSRAIEPSEGKDPPLDSGDVTQSWSDAESAGAAYLRSLKSGEPESQPATPETVPHQTAGQSNSLESGSGRERRRNIRYKCSGSAEFRLANTDIRTWGTLTDVSLQGCYVEMMQTSPTGTLVDLVLRANGFRVEVKGEVRVNYPFLGMGIIFTEISEEERHHLQDLLESFSRPTHPSALIDNERSEMTSATTLPVIVDATAALSSIIRFFETRSTLSRRDFEDLIRHSQRQV